VTHQEVSEALDGVENALSLLQDGNTLLWSVVHRMSGEDPLHAQLVYLLTSQDQFRKDCAAAMAKVQEFCAGALL
jgi:hypothetical protein